MLRGNAIAVLQVTELEFRTTFAHIPNPKGIYLLKAAWIQAGLDWL